MSERIFRIRDGQLLLPEGATSLSEALQFPVPPAQNSKGYLAATQGPDRSIGGLIDEVLRAYICAPIHIRFVLAINEDVGEQEEVIALNPDNEEIVDGFWKIVPRDHWTEDNGPMPMMRIFPSREAAMEILTKPVIALPVDCPKGWSGIKLCYLNRFDNSSAKRLLGIDKEPGWRITKFQAHLFSRDILVHHPFNHSSTLVELTIDEEGVRLLVKSRTTRYTEIYYTAKLTHAEAREQLRLF